MINPSRVRHVRIAFLFTTFLLLCFLTFFATPGSRVATSHSSPRASATRATARNNVLTAKVTDASGSSTTVNPPVTSWSGINLALGRPAEQSSTGSWGGITGSAGLAVDGKTDGSFWSGSVAHTLYDDTPWWQVDVGNADIHRIDIWNRTDCCSERLANYYVFVSTQPFSPSDTIKSIISRGVWYQYLTTTAATPSAIDVNQPGRYVRVQLAGPNYLHMAEVQVWGTAQSSLTPVAHWKFDDDTNTSQAVDSSGNGNTGTLQNGPVWTTGQNNNALSFDGLNDVVTVSSGTALTSAYNNFTISFWAQPLSTHEIDAEGTDIWGGVANQRYAIGPQHGAAAYGSSDHAGVGVSVGTNGVSVYEHSDAYMPATLVYSAGLKGWKHIVVVYEDRQPRLYLNGVLVRTGVKSTKPYVHIVPDQIGGMGYGYFNGKLDDVRIYNRVLSQAEINLLYSSSADALPASPTNLKASPTSATRENFIDGSQLTSNDATQVTLTWEDNSDNESGFKIERYDSDHPYWIEVAVVPQDVTSFVDTGASIATTPLYRVRAASALGDSVYSNVATTAQTTCGQVQFGRQIGGDKTSIIIGWNPPDEGAPAGYLVRYRPLTEPDSEPILLPPLHFSANQIEISNLTPGTAYFVEIQTVCNGENSEWAIALGVTDPEECEHPRNLNVTGVTSTSAIAHWKTVDGARRYKVQVLTGGLVVQDLPPTTGDTIQISNLTPATDYEVRVSSICSMDGTFTSEPSSATFHTADDGPAPTDCLKPENFKVVGIDAAYARAKWNEVAASEKYPFIKYYIEYTNDPEGTILREVNGMTEWPMRDLTPGTAHQAHVKTLCVGPGGQTFAWSDFTPDPPEFCGLSWTGA